MEIQNHDQINAHTPPELDKHRSHQQDIHQHGRQQQWQQRPLMIIIGHIPGSPDIEEVPPQLDKLLPQRFFHLWRRIATPPAIRAQRGQIALELRQGPRDDHGNRRRQDQTRGSTKSTFSHGRKAPQVITVARHFDGFQGADVAGQEGEDGHANPALPGNAQDGPLEDAWGGIFGVAGGEEVIVPGAGEMGEDDKEGCDTTEALLYSPESIIIPKVNPYAG